MGKPRRDRCQQPGPYAAHCTEWPGHQYSCYDAGEDVSFNDRQDFVHNCGDVTCPDDGHVSVGD